MEYYRYLYDCSSYAIIGMDCQGLITSWNRSAEQLFSAAAASMMGQHIEQVIPAKKQDIIHEAIKSAITQRQSREFEFEHNSISGKALTLAVMITPVTDNRGVVLGLAAWLHDISRRKELEEQLVEVEKMASLGTLASGVAHHFNNIIAGVATFVDFALNSDNPKASRRALQMTAEAAQRISKITTSLLTFAEKENTHHLDLSDLTEVILTFCHLVEKPLSKKNIKLNMHIQPISIYEAPGKRIHQILGNLLDNAEYAMAEGGILTIALREESEHIILQFSDNGQGIAPKDLPHIFEPFYTTRGVAVGGNHACSGLGLSVVHGIIRELGGVIEVNSRVGKGTTFTIRFPSPTKSSEPKLS